MASDRPPAGGSPAAVRDGGPGPRPFAPCAEGVLLREQIGAVAVLTLNRPEKRNALDADSMRALTAGFADADRDPAVRAVVVTGSGSAFCSGDVS